MIEEAFLKLSFGLCLYYVKAGDTEETRNGYEAGRGHTEDSMSTEGSR